MDERSSLSPRESRSQPMGPAPIRGGEDNPSELRDEVEQTRGELSETLEAIKEWLSPEHLKDQATTTMREATVGKAEQMVSTVEQKAKGAGATMVDTIKANPIPAALAAMGIGWLVMEGPSSTTPPPTSMQPERGMSQTAGQLQSKGGELVGRVEGKLGRWPTRCRARRAS
jgi:Protein of unknown function (DUF3618)